MKYLISFCLVLFAFLGMAQGVKSTTAAMNGVTVSTVDLYNTSGADALSIQTVYTEVGGTSDGTVTLQVSNDGSNFVTVNPTVWIGEADGSTSFSTAAAHTVTDGSTWIIDIKEPSFYVYRLRFAGTANDTTSVAVSWKFNK